MPIVTLKDLENKKIITLSHSFGGCNLMDMESGLNNIFLKAVELANNGASLKLIGETVKKSEVSGYIKSDNLGLLKEIKKEIEKLRNKTISDIYCTKLDIGLNV